MHAYWGQKKTYDSTINGVCNWLNSFALHLIIKKKKTFCFAFGCLVSCMVPLVHCKASVPILWHSLTLWWDDKCWSTFFGPYLFLCLNKQGTPLTKLWMSQSGRHGKTCGSGLGSGQSSCGSNGSRVILSGLKTGSGRVGPYFSHEFFYFLFL